MSIIIRTIQIHHYGTLPQKQKIHHDGTSGAEDSDDGQFSEKKLSVLVEEQLKEIRNKKHLQFKEYKMLQPNRENMNKMIPVT